MENNKNDFSTVCEMFEEMKSKLDTLAAAQNGLSDEDRQTLLNTLERVTQLAKTADRKDFTPEQDAALKRIEGVVDKALRDFHNSEYMELKTAIEWLEKAVNEAKTAKQPDKIPHRHTLNFEGKYGIIGVILAVVALFASLSIIDHQRKTIARLRDNDLKYRHIQMRGAATPADIKQLRNVFDWNRNLDSIRTIRKQVEQYERLIQEGIEKSERARLNSAEAERLKKAAETVRRGK